MSHFTLQDRITIQSELSHRSPFHSIALLLSKSPSTISREIRNHLLVRDRSSYPQVRMMNDCVHRFECRLRCVCQPHCRFQNGNCRFCGHCFRFCQRYEKEICPSLSHPPYVCNGCPHRNRCTLEQKDYKADVAHQEYRDTLVESRSGFNLSELELTFINRELTPLIKDKKQSVHHACLVKADILPCDEKTIYNLIDANLLPDIKNLDLPRKCRLKPRKSGRRQHKVDKKCRLHRTYEDFQNFIQTNPDVSIVEMDTVEGVKGGKCILTFLFRSCNFQLYFLTDHHTSQAVIHQIDQLYEQALGPELFKKMFELILTDNGSEFSNPTAIENDALNQPRSRLFYCDPAASYQKGACENNHEMLRRFFPKGSSFDDLTQEQLNLISSHINSYKRKRLNNHSPIELFSLLFGNETLDKLGVVQIAPENVCLSLPWPEKQVNVTHREIR
ncbi:IS30 family transposase [Holdemania massiliensis]|uniref:IS30 family transposase n=1 Tax=Holdemania massiliensis TaxID=1468449 RepID=UPI00351FC63D